MVHTANSLESLGGCSAGACPPPVPPAGDKPPRYESWTCRMHHQSAAAIMDLQSASKPVGIFDSGVGGVTVLNEVRRLLPGEDVVYYADTANCPYGPRPPEEIRRLSLEAARFLMDHGAKVIVVACNTASSAALAALRATFPIPFVGVVPAVKPAALNTRAGKVGVIATQATVQAQLFADLVAQFANGAKVFTQACPGLVELVEAGKLDSPATEDLLHRYLDGLVAQGIDTLVLGCTHYPLLRPTIQRLVGPKVAVIDSGEAIARQVKRVLEGQGALDPRETGGKVTYYASGDQTAFLRTLHILGNGSEAHDGATKSV